MRKNSQTVKSSFGLFFLLISILIMGLTFGTEVVKMMLCYVAVLAVAIFIMGLATVLVLTIKEEIMRRK